MEHFWKDSLQEDLECTICLDPAVSPIYNCSNGHIVCGFCFDKVKKCGLCMKLLIPCGLAERMVRKYEMELLCKNYSSGCQTLCKSTEMMDHSRLCEYRPITCFETRKGVCGVSYSIIGFYEHLMSHHKTPKLNHDLELSSSSGAVFSFSLIRKMENRDQNAQFSLLCFKFDSKCFLVHSMLVRGAFCWWITVIGGQNEADSYYYKTKISSISCSAPSKKMEINWRLPVLPLHNYNTFEKVAELGQYVNACSKMILEVQSFNSEKEHDDHLRFVFDFEINKTSSTEK